MANKGKCLGCGCGPAEYFDPSKYDYCRRCAKAGKGSKSSGRRSSGKGSRAAPETMTINGAVFRRVK